MLQSPCWEMPEDSIGNHGYGRAYGGGGKLAPREVYQALRGPIPPGFVPDHLCENRACCNPWHLKTVTQADNNRRKSLESLRKGGLKTGARRSAKPHCKHGHEFTDENTLYHSDGRKDCRQCKENRTNRSYEKRTGRTLGARARRRLLCTELAAVEWCNSFERYYHDLLRRFGAGETAQAIADSLEITASTFYSVLANAISWAKKTKYQEEPNV